MSITPEKVVEAYVTTRNEISKIEKEAEERVAALKELQSKREGYLLKQLQDLGAQNIKTNAGTVYQAKKESVRVSEWDAFVKWSVFNPVLQAIHHTLETGGNAQQMADEIIKSVKIEFFNKAVDKTAVLEAMGNERTEPAPPGVDYTAIRTVQVRTN